MIVLNNYIFGAGGGSPPGGATFEGAVIYRTTNSATLTSGDDVPYQSELYDDGNYADIGTHAERLTVTDAGLYRGTYSAGHSGTQIGTRLRVNGGAVPGTGGSLTSNLDTRHNGCGAVFDLAAADYITLEDQNGVQFGYNNDDKYSWLAIERLPDDLSYCLLRKQANQTAPGWGTQVAVTYGSGSTVHDPDGYHDESTNNTRQTTLSGQDRVRLVAGFVSSGNAGTSSLCIRKNGAGMTLGGTLTPGLPFYIDYTSATVHRASVMTPPLPSNGGTDYFEQIVMLDATNIAASDETFFEIEEVPGDIYGCLAYKSSAFALTTSYQDFPLDTDVYDDASIHDAAGSSAEFIVPSGATHARFHFCAGQGDMCRARAMFKPSGGAYGEIVGGSAQSSASGAFWHYGTGRTPWLPVAAGDAFKMQAHSDRSANSIAGCWAALELRPRAPFLTYTSATLTEDIPGGVYPQFFDGFLTPTFTLVAGSLPAGMSLNSATGAITGTPTTSGTSSGLQVEMSYGGSDITSAAFSITVVAGFDEYELRFFGSNDGAGDVLVRELTMATSHGGADITAGRPTSGSGGVYSGAEGPDKAINNNTGDWWQPRCSPAASGQVTFGITFASAQAVNEITLDPHPSFLSRTPKSMDVYGRNGGGSWSLVASFSGWTSWSGLRTVNW